MSGPIVRQYGFPNFDKIFGARAMQHGEPDTDPDPEPSEPTQEPAEERSSEDQGSPPGANATEAEKQSEDSAKL